MKKLFHRKRSRVPPGTPPADRAAAGAAEASCSCCGQGVVSDRGMEIRELRAFAAVAEEGSLSAAARRLHLSQSALSQTIKSLERQLSVQLLLRSRTGVATTEAGAILLREGRELIAQYERTLAAVAASDGASPGNLKVGIPLELPAELLPGVLAELSTTFPLTRVEVSHASSVSQMAELEAGRLDLALVRECPADPR